MGEFPIHRNYILIDPVSSIRAMVNARAEEYQVTADSVPSFLYDDPLQFDPNDVFAGFMRGRFLIRVSENNDRSEGESNLSASVRVPFS